MALAILCVFCNQNCSFRGETFANSWVCIVFDCECPFLAFPDGVLHLWCGTFCRSTAWLNLINLCFFHLLLAFTHVLGFVCMCVVIDAHFLLFLSLGSLFIFFSVRLEISFICIHMTQLIIVLGVFNVYSFDLVM